MQKITPFLWFDNRAEDAANFYTSVFKDSKILNINRYPEGPMAPAGTVMTVNFEINGQEFTALNGGPHFTFSPAISFVVRCESQEEVDLYWEKLLDGGSPQQCGWLTDKFGVTWQIVPVELFKLLGSSDAGKAKRVNAAMLQMIKLDINVLRSAYNAD